MDMDRVHRGRLQVEGPCFEGYAPFSRGVGIMRGSTDKLQEIKKEERRWTQARLTSRKE